MSKKKDKYSQLEDSRDDDDDDKDETFSNNDNDDLPSSYFSSPRTSSKNKGINKIARNVTSLIKSATSSSHPSNNNNNTKNRKRQSSISRKRLLSNISTYSSDDTQQETIDQENNLDEQEMRSVYESDEEHFKGETSSKRKAWIENYHELQSMEQDDPEENFEEREKLERRHMKYESEKEEDDEYNLSWIGYFIKSLKSIYLFFVSGRVLQSIRGLLYQYIQYLIYSVREIRKRKMSYCLGFLSCLIVVWVVCITFSALNQVPLVFLRLAEQESGQYDTEMKAYDYLPGESLNYTKIQEKLQTEYNIKNIAPRIVKSISVFKATSCVNDNGNHFPKNYFKENYLNYEKIKWMYEGFNSNSTCNRICVEEYCSKVQRGALMFAIDTKTEKEIGFGRSWNLEAPAPGKVHISDFLANNLFLASGDVIFISFSALPELVGPFRHINLINDSKSDPDANVNFNSNFVFPVQVDQIYSDIAGKYGNTVEDAIIIDYESILKHFSLFLPPEYPASKKSEMKNTDLNHYAQYIYINLPNRMSVYNKNDYDAIVTGVVQYVSKIFYLLGPDQVQTRVPLLAAMSLTRFVSLFLALIISVIITILTVLSIILIYSLLMINVENRTFELGVLRMIGITRIGLIQLILCQALFYSAPALVVGTIFGQLTFAVVGQQLGGILGIEIGYFLTFESIGCAWVLGIFIPILSSILPIKTALGQNLHDSLDISRSKTKAVKYDIERASDNTFSWSQLMLGSGVAVFGAGTYYFFPLSLLSFNITILLYMFFSVILCMLFGLVLLSLNLETVLENLIAMVLLWWENSAARGLVLKNLIAHRMRNRKTTIMYALSLGFIIYISVSFNLQVSTFKYTIQRSYGSRIYVVSRYFWALSSPAVKESVEKIVRKHPQIKGYAYISRSLEQCTTYKSTTLSNPGKFAISKADVVAVSPNFFEIADRKFLKVTKQYNDRTSYDLAEKLYTVEGSSRILLSSSLESGLGASTDSLVLFEGDEPTEGYSKYMYRYFKPMAFLSASPALTFTMFPNEINIGNGRLATGSVAVSFPSFMRLFRYIEQNGNTTRVEELSGIRTLDQVPIGKIVISPKKSATEDDIGRFITELKNALNGEPVYVGDVEDKLSSVQVAVDVMNYFFIFTTIVAMFMCFFSLMSSMYTNVNEQAKEIGVLRAIGCGRLFVIRVFVYEALLLILSASFMGLMIGVTISYTMTIQRVLFTRLPISFFDNFISTAYIVVTIIVMAVVFSLASSLIPTISLTRKSVVYILRRFLS